MSYLQIEIKGKKYGLKFNQLALETYIRTIDWDNFTTIGEAYAIIWGGLKGNAFVKREELDLSFEDVCDFVEEMDSELLKEAAKLFTDTQAFKSWFESFNEKLHTANTDTTKKKVVKKK